MQIAENARPVPLDPRCNFSVGLEFADIGRIVRHMIHVSSPASWFYSVRTEAKPLSYASYTLLKHKIRCAACPVNFSFTGNTDEMACVYVRCRT